MNFGIWHKKHSDDLKEYILEMDTKAKVGHFAGDYTHCWYYLGHLIAQSFKTHTGWIHEIRKVK